LLRTPAAWPFALVPTLLLVVLSVLFAWAAVAGFGALLDGVVGTPVSGYGKALAGAISWIGSILAAILGLLIAVAVTPPLSGPALEHIVKLQERELGAAARVPIGFFAEMWCALRAQALAACFAVPLLVILRLVELFFPAAVFVTVPLELVVTALSLAWNLLDYPLTLRGVRMRDRLRLVLDNKLAALGFGLAFALLFWLPCFGVFLLPVGVAGATRILWRILGTNPKILPALPRPEVSSGPPRSPAAA
jgi:CysZ protein